VFSNTAWIWFCLPNGREFTGITWKHFHLGVNGPITLTHVQEELQEFGFGVLFCSLHSSPPGSKCSLFNNIQNVLIFGVVHMIFIARFVKHSKFERVFCLKKKKNPKNNALHL